MTYVVLTTDGDDYECESEQEAVAKAQEWLRNFYDHRDCWPEETDTYCRVLQVLYEPKMIDRVELKDMDSEQLEMAEAEGWDYICNYEMQKVT